MNPFYSAVASRAEHRCEYCHAPESIFNFPFEVEHIIPVSLGGQSVENNFALACRSCNLFKGANIQYPDPETNTTADLFDPRQDDWQTHFRVDIESTEIIGITPTGRATVTCLNINSRLQLEARKEWVNLGIFP